MNEKNENEKEEENIRLAIENKEANSLNARLIRVIRLIRSIKFYKHAR